MERKREHSRSSVSSSFFVLVKGFELDSKHSNGDFVIALGCIMMVQAPFAVKYGRRPVFIVSALLLFTCSIWSAVSEGIPSFLASRLFQGFGTVRACMKYHYV